MWELIICILAIKFFLLQKLIVLWYSWCWQWFLWTSSIKKQDVLGTSLTVTSFESTNTPLETWIVVLDSWIKEHKLQARALIEKKLLLLKHNGHSILLPPPPSFIDATPPHFNWYLFLVPSFFPDSCANNSMSIISLENLFAISIIDNSVATIIQVFEYNKIIIIHFEKLRTWPSGQNSKTAISRNFEKENK